MRARTFTGMYTLRLAQRLTLMKNVWEVSRVDRGEEPLGLVTQARMKLREEVTCTTPDGSGVVFTVKARNIIELAGTYDVKDASGNLLGVINKDFARSLGRSTYRVETPVGVWTVTETSQAKAIARRVVGLITDIPWLFRVQFSILDPAGNPVGHVNRANMKIKDTYEIRVENPALDMRLAVAIGVAVDAFMNR